MPTPYTEGNGCAYLWKTNAGYKCPCQGPEVVPCTCYSLVDAMKCEHFKPESWEVEEFINQLTDAMKNTIPVPIGNVQMVEETDNGLKVTARLTKEGKRMVEKEKMMNKKSDVPTVVVFRSKKDAEDVLSEIIKVASKYGKVTRSDIYELSGLSSAFSDNNYYIPEDAIREAKIEYDEYNGEYHLEFPETIFMDWSKNDPVNHPGHYTSGNVECIDAIEAILEAHSDPVAGWLTAQCVKYLWRWQLKNGLEDLEKARFYLDRLITREENDD